MECREATFVFANVDMFTDAKRLKRDQRLGPTKSLSS
jgi:hypothetical protein